VLTLHYASIILFFSLLILFLINLEFGSPAAKAANWLLGLLALLQFLIQWMIRIGYVSAASHFLLAIGWVAMTKINLSVGGIRDEAVFSYILILMASGYLLGWPIAAAYTLASISALWRLAFIEMNGLFVPTIDNANEAARDLTVVFILIFLVVYFLIRTLTQAIETSQRSEAKLKKLIAQLSDEITERKHAQIELKNQAITDFLTGLFNRRYFFEIAQKEFSKALRYERPLSVIIFDLDLFKNINDTYGHAIGDQALAQIGNLLRNTIRDVDISARYGGEEFIILLPEMDCENTEAAAERLRKKIQDTPINVEGYLVWMTISAGVASTATAIAKPTSVKSIDQLISKADQALYRAKRAGRNQVFCYKEEK